MIDRLGPAWAARAALGLVAFSAAALGLLGAAPAQAESIKVGISKLLSYPAVPIAIDRGYFKAEGIDAELVFFDSAQPIAVAVTSGGVDFGVSGLSAGFYNLAGQGQLRLIASSSGEQPGFYNLTFLASKKAYEAGLKSVKQLPGHDIAITQVGTSLHYAIGLSAQKFGFPLSAVEVKPLQSNSNVIAALRGGTISAAMMPGTPTLALVAKGDIRRLGWVGDLTPGWTGSACFTATKTTNERGDLVKRFMIAYRKGIRDYHDAFTAPDGKRKDGPGAPAMLEFLSKYTGIPAENIDKAVPYVDAEGRLDAADVAKQIAWYKSQNLLKGEVEATKLIDSRYATPMPAR
jgi:NitT/TauT family transport system substrate-binding protein